METPVLEPKAHEYFLNGRKLQAVSRVVDSLVGKSWDNIPESRRHFVDEANVRGRIVETLATQLFTDRFLVLPPDVSEAIDPWIAGVERWWREYNKPTLISAQQIVWSAADGVAGTFDFIFSINGELWLCDLKCCASVEKSWVLQLGAYEWLSKFRGRVGVLHVNPNFAKGYIFREYIDAAQKWETALRWYQLLQTL